MVSVMLYPVIICVSLLMDLFILCVACLTVFVNCLVKQFAICLGVVVILLLNVMEVFSVGGDALLDRPYYGHRACSIHIMNFLLKLLKRPSSLFHSYDEFVGHAFETTIELVPFI